MIRRKAEAELPINCQRSLPQYDTTDLHNVGYWILGYNNERSTATAIRAAEKSREGTRRKSGKWERRRWIREREKGGEVIVTNVTKLPPMLLI
jgi:hypothetical protein